jgi:RNA polymerase sigma-70 factor (ECF subfamily)
MSMLASTETASARSAQRHEDDAVPEFDALYRRHFRFTWSVLRRLGVPEAAIEDAAQEVWVIVHRRLDALESPRAVRSWLFQIARRVAARHRRGEQRSRRKIDAFGHLAAELTVVSAQEVRGHLSMTVTFDDFDANVEFVALGCG